MDDADYLRSYARTGSQDAFAALVQRTLPLVYATALRRVSGDVHRAQDVSQLVFTAVARNARTLAAHPDFTGWLFTTTRFLASKALRGERRRQSREVAASLTQGAMSDEPLPAEAAPIDAVLDDLLTELRQLDREVLLLRFHRGLRLGEIGARLGATENAVQKRLDRALEQLREKLARRGITSTAAAVAAAFEQQGAVAAPAGLAAAVTAAGLTCGVGAGGLAFSSLMTISKLQTAVAAAAIALTGTGLGWQMRENATLRAETANQAAATTARAAALNQQLTALTERAAAVEADAAQLQQVLRAAAPVAPAASPPRTVTDAREQARAVMDRAGQLIREGKFQEALDEYLKGYRTLSAMERGRVELQLLMSALKRLGRQYQPATLALRELRDTAIRNLQGSPNARDLVTEIGLLNERLGEGQATVALYDSLPVGDPGRQALGLIAHDAFVAARRYADALVGKSFGSMLNELDMQVRFSGPKSARSQDAHRGFVIKGTLSGIEVLTGAGHHDEARMLTEKLLAFDDSVATRAAIQEHVERARQPR